MHIGKELKRNVPVMLLFWGIVTVRYLLALLTSTFPTVGIDEFLYYNIGRSIATERALLFHGQPATYSYILYPLVLSPIYRLFHEGTNFYRVIQLWNIILMTTSVFPIKALFGKIVNNRKAIFPTAICMLLADFMLGQLIFSEALLYPLFYTAFYCIYVYINEKTFKHLMIVSVLGGLMYCTKPGSALPILLFLLFALVNAIIKKEKKTIFYTIAGLLATSIVIVLFWCLAKYVFGYKGSMLSIYNSQLGAKDGWHIDVFIKSVLTYPYYFILSCGIIGFIFPLLSLKYWNEKQKKFCYFVLISLFFMIIGIAWTVNRTEFKANILHLRYISMYIPLMLFFCFVPYEPKKKHKQIELHSKAMLLLSVSIMYVVFSTFFWGCKTGAQTTSKYPLSSLIVLINQALPLSSQMVGNIIIICFCVAFFFISLKLLISRVLQKISVICLMLFMLINNVCGYVFISEDSNTLLATDGLKALSLTDGHSFIYLRTIEGIMDCGVDVNTKRNVDMVFMNDFINHLYENHGIYIPFVPEPARGFTSEKLTADVDTLILDNTSYPLIQLSPYATVTSVYQRDNLFVVHFTPQERLVDSTIGNVINRTLVANKPGILLIYTQELLQHPLTIHFDIESNMDQTMKVFCSKELHTIELKKGRSWYEITFNKPEDAFNFIVENDNITIYEYKLS